MQYLKDDYLKNLIKQYYVKKIQAKKIASCTCNNDTYNKLGYNENDLNIIPDSAKLNLSCGNPLTFSRIKKGDIVLDLGSGAGMDCFIAAKETGENGMVIGIDMLDEMIDLAKENAQKMKLSNVKFLKADIENLNLDNESIDLIISNCVINLSEKKEQVFNEAYRVLKIGGRLAISDIVSYDNVPLHIRNNKDLHVCCISGAENNKNLEKMLNDIGFKNVYIYIDHQSKELIKSWSDDEDLSKYYVSARIEAEK
jgi:ubiquinone/menaquinone biosynthesis C-methylase UbiE